MAAAVRRCMTFVVLECQRIASDVRVISSILQGHGHNYAFNLAIGCEPHPQNTLKESELSPNVLDSIFSNVLLAVQRNRRTLERRMTRRMQMPGHFEYAVPRKDIVVDLDTGHWKEKGTVCKHHYAKVKAEVEEMRAALGEAMRYTADQRDVVFLYRGEESQAAQLQQQGKHVVLMDKERPAWFSRDHLHKTS